MNEADYKAKKRKKGRSKSKKNRFSIGFKLLLCFAAVISIVYLTGSFISAQTDIADMRKELDSVNGKITEIENENDTYRSKLSEADERKFMERIAIEDLGYAYPNERRFYDTNGN